MHKNNLNACDTDAGFAEALRSANWRYQPTMTENVTHLVRDASGRGIAEIDGPDIAMTGHLMSAAPDLYLIAALVAKLPIQDHLPDDVPVFGVDGEYITQGDVKDARKALMKAEGKDL